jgi:hypothetical protein
LFEDVPSGAAQPNCADAGVMGPVVGLIGALMADLALRILTEDSTAYGRIYTYDGTSDRLRAVDVTPRAGCPLCSEQRTIFDIQESRYTAPSIAARCETEKQSWKSPSESLRRFEASPEAKSRSR